MVTSNRRLGKINASTAANLLSRYDMTDAADRHDAPNPGDRPMANQSPFIAEAKQVLAAFTLQPLPLDQSLGLIEAKGGSIRLECYTADKFEKIVLCTIEIEATSLVEASVLAWPEAGYDLPILWCNLTRVPQVMNVAVFDFLPVMDPVLQPEQTAASIEGLRTLKANALTLFGDTIIDKAVMLPSRAVYALSPYITVVNLSEAGLVLISQPCWATICVPTTISGNRHPWWKIRSTETIAPADSRRSAPS
jgi:hypothetical protein